MKFTYKTFLFWLLVICSQTIASSQTFYDTFDQIENKYGIYELEKGLDSLLQNTEYPDTYRAMAHDFSVQFYWKSDYQAAVKYALLEVESFEKHEIKNKTYLKAVYQLGIFYNFTSQTQEAIHCFNKVITTDPNSRKALQSYSELGESYLKLGNYYQSEIYYLKAIAEIEKTDEPLLLAAQYLSLSRVYGTINTEESVKKELNVLNKSLQLNEIHKFDNRKLSILYNNLANYYNTDRNYDFNLAKFYYNKVIDNALEENDKEIIGGGYLNLGNIYIEEKKDSAIYFLKKSLQYPLTGDSESLIYRNLANFEIQKNNLTGALSFLDQALQSNFPEKNLNLDQPSLTTLKNGKTPIEVLTILSKKADVLLKQYDKLKEDYLVKAAFRNLQTADSLIDDLKSSNREENSRLYWRKEASKMYHKAVYCSYLLGDNELAFLYSEKNKAILLTENIIENSIKLPQFIESRKEFLKAQLIEYEQNVKSASDSASLQFYTQSLINQKIVLKNYTDSLAAKYPILRQRVNNSQLISLNEAQQKLSENELIISYVWNNKVDFKDHLMCLIISNNEIEVLEIQNAKKLNDDIKHMRQMVSKPFKTLKDKSNYNSLAHGIYNALFPNKNLQKKIQGKTITIIADGQLQNIPFDALIIDEQNGTYLIESSQVNNVYSLSFSKSNQAIERINEKDLIAFSPTKFSGVGLPQLYNTNAEVKSINKFINGTNYLNEKATNEIFKQEVNNYKIVHLATHASAGENPYIAFYDGMLGLKELYTIENNAQLVFLSACETSVGEIAQGEGTLTLARGFFNTGAQAVVASLWKTNDQSTSFIVENFYKNIKEGHGVSTSLHLAKLNYIKQHKLSESSPFYWSALIALGENDVIELNESSSTSWLIYLILLLLSGAIALYIIKFYKK